MIPILDLKKQIAPLRSEIDAAIKRVIDSTDFILGEEVRLLEEAVQDYLRAKFATGVSNGTDAIRLALIACGVQSGEGVICPAFTYYATAGAIAATGGRPVFADIDPRTYNISVAGIEAALKLKEKLRIKAIIPVHLYGQCADMDKILKIARDNGLKVIEDTAQAFGAEYKGKKAGTLGDCGSISLFPGKNLGAFGDAGMVLTHDEKMAKDLKILRNQGNEEKYFHIMLGHNNRMDSIQAAVVRVKLKYLDAWNKKRQEMASFYSQGLSGLKVATPFVPEYTTHIYHQYVLRLNTSSRPLREYLRGKGIDARVYYPVPLHLQKCFGYLGYRPGDFPESEKAAEQTLAIPVYPDLTQEESEYIVASIKEFLK